MKKIETTIRDLIERSIELDDLEVEYNKIKPRFAVSTSNSALDVLFSQLQSKLEDGREFQSNCVTIIASAQENEFTPEGIKVIEQLMKDAKKLNLEFPELRRLETVRLIPKWISRLHAIILETDEGKKEGKQTKKSKPLRSLRQEAMKGLDALEPTKMTQAMKTDLIAALTTEVPEVLDQELSKLLKKIQVILWIKDAYDLVGKEEVSLENLSALLDSPAGEEANQQQQLKFKYMTYHKQIQDLVNSSESWLAKASNLEAKLPALDSEAIVEKAKHESLKKGLETLKKGMNSNIERVLEVKQRFQSIQKAFGRIEWVNDCTAFLMNTTEKKQLDQLESLYQRAEECKVPRTWTMFASIEALYTQVKDLAAKSKKILGDSLSKMEIEEPSTAATKGLIEIMDYEKKFEQMKAKITMDELDQQIIKMKELNAKVDFGQAIEMLEASKKNQEKYIQTITRCYNAHQTTMENYKDTPNEDLLQIRAQINEINKLESTIVVALPKYDAYYLKLHWSIDCAFFLSSSLNTKMKKYLDACGKLVRAQKVIKDIDNTKLFQSLNEQLNIYNKCNDAVELLKKDEKRKKAEERQALITTKNFRELENALRVVTIEDSQVLFKYVQKLKRKIESAIEEYDEAMRSSEKYPLKFWKDLLDRFYTSKIPVKCDEECMLEIMIQTAEEMETQLKGLKKVGSPVPKKRGGAVNAAANQQAIEILERYRLQQVKLPEAEKLLDKIKLKEDALSVIEKRLYSSSATGEQLQYTEIIKIIKEVHALQNEFKGDRMERLKQELFLKKILLLKDLQENNGQMETSSVQQMKELENDTKRMFEKRIEPRFIGALAYLSEFNAKCAERVKQIDAINNIKELENILEDEADTPNTLRFVGFVDFSNEINERIAVLKAQKDAARKKDQEKRQREKDSLKEKQQKMEEEKKQRLLNDPRAQKRQEAEEKMQERIANSKRNATQFKQQCISDVAKAINQTFSTINLQDCLTFGTTLVDRSLIENQSAMTPTGEQVAQICKLFDNLKRYTYLSAGVKKSKFEWNEIQRLIKLTSSSNSSRGYKEALDKEEKMVQVTHTIKQSESSSLVMNDVRFRRKDDYQMTPNIPYESAAGTANASPVQSSQQQPITHQQLPQKKPTKLPSFLPQIDLLFGGLGASKKEDFGSSFVNIDDNNITKQSVAKIREGKLSMAKLGLISNNGTSSSSLTQRPQAKRFGAKFSDDEDDESGVNEYVPLREEDFKTLNESLSLSAQKRRPDISMGQFDPDAETVSQKTDEAADASQVVSMLQGALQIVVDSNDPNVEPQMISINRVFVLSSEDVKECMMMPQCPAQKSTMVVKGVLSLSNFNQYHQSLISEKQLNPERKIRVLGGWFETELSNDHSELQAYANYLKMRNRVAVIEWTPECKLYAMHRDQWNNNGNENQTIKFKRNFFHNSSNPNDTLLFLMIFKQYKLFPDQNSHYENVRPIFMQKRAHAPANESTTKPLSTNQSQNAISLLVSQSTNKISVADNKASVGGKKSFGKMSALEALTFESDEEDADEERRLNERVLALKNQFQRNNNNNNNNNSNSNMEMNNNNNRLTPNNHSMNNDRFARIGSQQSQNYNNTNNNNPRYNNNNGKQSVGPSYPRSANRSGVSTPNYYEQQSQFGQDQLADALSRHIGSTQKPVYQRTLNFKTSESMDVEPEQYPSFSRNGNMPYQQQQHNMNHSYNQFNNQYQQRYNNNINSQNNNQINANKQNNFNSKRPHHMMQQGGSMSVNKFTYKNMNNQNNNNNMQEDDMSIGQDPNRIGSILSTLDQTLRELIKSQKTKEQSPSEYLINTLLQQQQQQAFQQQQKLLQQLSKQTSANAAVAAAVDLLGDKKKKTRKRKKRPMNGLNQSMDGGSSMSEDESQDSFPIQPQRSMSVVQSHSSSYQQPIGQTSRINPNNNPNNNNSNPNSNNIQVHNNYYQKASVQPQQTNANAQQQLNRNTPYLNALNNKKQLKIFDKQSVKMSQLDQPPRNNAAQNHNAAQGASFQQTQSQPHFARNQQQQQAQPIAQQQQQQQVQQAQQTQQVYGRQGNNATNSTTLKPTIQFTTAAQTAASLSASLPVPNPQSNSLTALNSLHNLMKLNPNNNLISTPGNASNSTANSAAAIGNTSVNTNNGVVQGLISQQNQQVRGINSIGAANANTQAQRVPQGIQQQQQSQTGAAAYNQPQANRSLSNNQRHQANNNYRSRQYEQDQYHGRQLLTDLSKSGRINQERTNSFHNLRGESKEAANPSEIPRYMKEKSVRNPTFYQTKQEQVISALQELPTAASTTVASTTANTRVTSVPTTPQPSSQNNAINPNNSSHSNHSNNNSVIPNRKSNFSYSSVGSRDPSMETSFDKENGLKQQKV